MSDDHHETGAWRVIEAGPAFADEMARVHAASIRGTCGSHYTEDQIEAWAGSKTPDIYTTRMAVEGNLFFVAISDDAVPADPATAPDLGTVMGIGQVDLPKAMLRILYVDPDHQGKGVGVALMNACEEAFRGHLASGLSGGDGGGGGEVEPACDDKEDDCSDPANLLRLESALNAVSFYERHGWVRDAAEGKEAWSVCTGCGCAETGVTIGCVPMMKVIE